MTLKIISAYGKKTQRPQINCGPGLTEQSHQGACDVNNILKQYIKTGNLSHSAIHEAQYGVHSSLDLHTALNVVTSANSMFNELPAETRAKFKNDPGTFLDFVQDEKNLKEMYTLGLATKQTPLKNEPEAPSSDDPEATPNEKAPESA